VISFTLK